MMRPGSWAAKLRIGGFRGVFAGARIECHTAREDPRSSRGENPRLPLLNRNRNPTDQFALGGARRRAWEKRCPVEPILAKENMAAIVVVPTYLWRWIPK